MNKWKSYIGMLFLAVLSLSIVPRSLLHDCDHAHTISADDGGDEVLRLADCAICDYHFSTYSPVEAFAFPDAVSASVDFQTWPETAPHIFSEFRLPARGPPFADLFLYFRHHI